MRLILFWSIAALPAQDFSKRVQPILARNCHHTRLTYRYQGRDFHLTDTVGAIVLKLI